MKKKIKEDISKGTGSVIGRMFFMAIMCLMLVIGYSIGAYFSKSEKLTIVSDSVVDDVIDSIETICPELNTSVEECLPCVCIDSTDTSKEELDRLINMNRNLAERLKTQYEKDPQTKSWSKLCLPDEYECLLK